MRLKVLEITDHSDQDPATMALKIVAVEHLQQPFLTGSTCWEVMLTQMLRLCQF